MKAKRPVVKNAFAVVIATTAALFARSWLQVELLKDGLHGDYAADLSYLVVPPIFLVLALPVFHQDRAFLIEQFRPTGLSLSIILRAVVVGILVRVLWWATTVAGIAFGLFRNDNPFAIEGPLFSFQCAATHVVLLGFLVMAVMVPVVEEITHRAYVQSAMQLRGPVVAIASSAAIFAVYHPSAHWPFAFVAGVVFGAQYWSTGSLWPSLISHATVNGLIQIDWRCLNGVWNPQASDLPLWGPGILATCVIVFALISLFCLTFKKKSAAANNRRGTERITERLRHVR